MNKPKRRIVGHPYRVCTFDAVGPVSGKMFYQDFKAKVLRAGRFSIFEATGSKRAARFYISLDSDPTIEIERSTFPWILVRAR